MGVINPTTPTIGDLRGSEEADLRNALIALLAEFNGNIEDSNVKAGANVNGSKLLDNSITAAKLVLAARPRILIPINTKGALPVGAAGNFTPQGGHCYAVFQSSGYALALGVSGVRLELDDVQVALTDMRFAATNVPAAIPFGIADLGTPTATAHKLRLTTATLGTDVDSAHRVIVLEVPA